MRTFKTPKTFVKDQKFFGALHTNQTGSFRSKSWLIFNRSFSNAKYFAKYLQEESMKFVTPGHFDKKQTNLQCSNNDKWDWDGGWPSSYFIDDHESNKFVEYFSK